MHESQTEARVEDRFVAAVRCVLAIAALLVILIDPTEPDRFVAATYATLIAYSVFSVGLLVLNAGPSWLPDRLRNPYWIDVGWYLVFVALSRGTGTIFFFFFYFAILNASFRRGFRTGMLVSVVSAVGFTLVGYFTPPDGPPAEFDRVVLRPASLLILGFMMASWGERQLTVLRRLDLLKDLARISNPRFGVEKTVNSAMNRLREFFDADECLLIDRRGLTGGGRLIRSAGNGDSTGTAAAQVDGQIVSQLSELSAPLAGFYRSHRAYGLLPLPSSNGFDIATCDHAVDDEKLMELAQRLDAGSLLTAPIAVRGRVTGRLILYAKRSTLFEPSDVPFLIQALEHFASTLDNIRLVDTLASEAASGERRKIALDVHDSVIQPYVGLQMAIDALEQYVSTGAPAFGEIKARIGKLRALARSGVDDLREYISTLRQKRGLETSLVPSLRQFGEKFAAATGIDVTIDHTGRAPIMDRLAAELFQITAEGLSNIRRHTNSDTARIDVAFTEEKVTLMISNSDDGSSGVEFRPHSIVERTTAIGGTVEIIRNDGRVTVKVTIPL